MSLHFINGAFKLNGAQTVRYEVSVDILPKPTVVEVPTAAPEPVPVVVEVAPVPEPEPVVVEVSPAPEPEPVVVEIPIVSEVEAPAEVDETAA